MKTLMIGLALVSSAFSLSSAFASDASQVTACHGNEPFWGLELKPSKIVFTKDVVADSSTLTIARPAFAASAEGRSSEYLAMYQGKVKEQPGRYLNVIIEKKECSDSMSDESYPFSVLVLSGNTLWSGCCRAGK